MNPAEKAIKFVDRSQPRLPELSFVVAVHVTRDAGDENGDEKMPEGPHHTPSGSAPAGSGTSPVSAGIARGEEPHDSGEDR